MKTLLERQNYPARRQSDTGQPDRPYDVAGWTLPAQMGVEVKTIERTFEPPAMSRLDAAGIAPANVWGDPKPVYYVIDGRGNAGAIAVNRLVAAGVATSWSTVPLDAGGFHYDPGSIVVSYTKQSEVVIARIAKELGLRADGLKGKPPAAVRPIGRARVALYKSWVENIDEGWTRWLLEQYEFPFTSIADAEIRAGNLRAKYDVIILPSAPSDQMIVGNPEGTVPPEYTGGLGGAGLDALQTFVESGGTVVALDEAGKFAISAFKIPVRDVAHEAGDKFFCPGSILRLDVDVSQPLAYGMSPHTGAFFAFSSAYEPLLTRSTADGRRRADPERRSDHRAIRRQRSSAQRMGRRGKRYRWAVGSRSDRRGFGARRADWISCAASRPVARDLSSAFQCDLHGTLRAPPPADADRSSARTAQPPSS